jgi:hypothetical protein
MASKTSLEEPDAERSCEVAVLASEEAARWRRRSFSWQRCLGSPICRRLRRDRFPADEAIPVSRRGRQFAEGAPRGEGKIREAEVQIAASQWGSAAPCHMVQVADRA